MRFYFLTTVLLVCSHANAGIYGSENWGEMYWGDNPATAPTETPSIVSAVATEDQITITLSNFPVGTGADGWSAVTSYTVTCGEASVTTSETAVTITGLDSDTNYSCSVTASNAQGEGPDLVKVVATDAVIQGMNIMLICAAIDCRTQAQG
jgi:hypothetical protein